MLRQRQNAHLNLAFALLTRAVCPNIINTKADGQGYINSVKGVYCSATATSLEVMDMTCQGLGSLLLWNQLNHFITLFSSVEQQGLLFGVKGETGMLKAGVPFLALSDRYIKTEIVKNFSK